MESRHAPADAIDRVRLPTTPWKTQEAFSTSAHSPYYGLFHLESDLAVAALATGIRRIGVAIYKVRRNLARLLEGRALEQARSTFDDDWQRIYVVALDEVTCDLAADLAETTGARTLDALHLAAASRVGSHGLTFVTFDVRQAQAARSLGMVVVGG